MYRVNNVTKRKITVQVSVDEKFVFNRGINKGVPESVVNHPYFGAMVEAGVLSPIGMSIQEVSDSVVDKEDLSRYVLDDDGNKIQAEDDDGEPMFTEDGEPLYQLK